MPTGRLTPEDRPGSAWGWNVKRAIVQCRGEASRCSAHVRPAEVVMTKRRPLNPLTHVRGLRA